MNFELNQDAVMLARTVGEFARKEIEPSAGDWSKAGAVPADLFGRLGALGLLGVMAPEALGGFDLGWPELVLTTALLAEASAGLGLAVGWHNGAVVPAAAQLAAARSDFTDVATGLATGQALGAWIDEACRFEIVDTESGPRISGTASLIPGAQQADWILGQVGVGEAAVVFAVARSAARITGKRALGMGAAGLADVVLDGATPAALVAWPQPVSRDPLIEAAVALGVAKAAFKAGAGYAQERTQFGKPLTHFQAIQWMIADGATAIDCAALLMDAGAAQGRAGQAEMARQAAVAAGMKVTDDALQIHGGYGYTREYAVERHWRDARYFDSAAPAGRFDQRIVTAALKDALVDAG